MFIFNEFSKCLQAALLNIEYYNKNLYGFIDRN
jgi:hypothetical protein